MKLGKILFVALIAVFHLPLAWAAGNPAGNWTTLDDKTGEKRAVINLSVSDGTLSGTIVKIYPHEGNIETCANCPGSFKDQKIQGLRLVWGLKDDGNGVWSGGSILDPKSGKIYKAKMSVEGDKLHVRGYLGVSMLGRTQTWVR